MGWIIKPQKKEKLTNNLNEIVIKIIGKSPRLKPSSDNLSMIDEILKHFFQYEPIIQKGMLEENHLDKEEELDHHKLAAAFCCSVLKTKPISYNADKSGGPPTNIENSANEQCAFLFGLQIIQNRWEDNMNDEKYSAVEREIYNNVIMIPAQRDENVRYTDLFVKLINQKAFKHFDYENKEKFDGKLLFFIAHIYFLIESYSFIYYKKH